jgi:hypothetical protein
MSKNDIFIPECFHEFFGCIRNPPLNEAYAVKFIKMVTCAIRFCQIVKVYMGGF